LSKTFFDKSKACSRRFQNSPFGLKQLKSLILRFAKMYKQKTFKLTAQSIWATARLDMVNMKQHQETKRDKHNVDKPS